MRLLILDPSYGCAGDMILGALVDVGLDFDRLTSELAKLNLPGYRIHCERTERNHIACTRVIVECKETATHRHLRHIKEIISSSSLSENVKANAIAVFERLAEAEAAVHGTSPDSVHFHEVGAVDAIVDIVGACIGFEILDVREVRSRPIALGAGVIDCAHGKFPVPSPATSNLVRGFPVRLHTISAELTTPTGAAIISTLATPLINAIEFTVLGVGYGAGTRSFDDHPNVMRVFLADDRSTFECDKIVQIETNIDDMSGEVFSHLFEVLFDAGALDVYVTPVIAKKNRPGQLITVLCNVEQSPGIESMLFTESSTSGIRVAEISRKKLPRRVASIATPLGDCSVKIFDVESGSRMVPEYESVKKIAQAGGMAYLDAYNLIIAHLCNMEKE
jgi:uncharacterized protein (TIGR00299 family) protein